MNPQSGTAHGRVEVLGNHTDYNGGLVLAMGVEFSTEVRGSIRADDRLVFEAKNLKEFLPTFKREASRPLGHEISCFTSSPSGS